MKIYLNLLLSTLLFLAACDNSTRETPNGMKYSVLRENDSPLPKPGDVLVFNYILREADSVWTDTWDDGVPAATMINDSSRIPMEDGMTQMFRMLSAGDSVTTTMTLGTFFRKIVGGNPPPSVDTTRLVTYVVGVEEITTEEDFMRNREPMVYERDTRKIDEFIKQNNITAEQDSSGLRYVIYNREGGVKPKAGDCVEVKYLGRLMKNGRPFDGAERASFPLTNNLIMGWQIGIPLLGVGDSATFFIPSRLAYGQRGAPGAIPADAVLIFDVTLIDVKKEYDRASRACK